MSPTEDLHTYTWMHTHIVQWAHICQICSFFDLLFFFFYLNAVFCRFCFELRDLVTCTSLLFRQLGYSKAFIIFTHLHLHYSVCERHSSCLRLKQNAVQLPLFVSIFLASPLKFLALALLQKCGIAAVLPVADICFTIAMFMLSPCLFCVHSNFSFQCTILV